jgi:P27 family predicted phage terminase small subunit
MPEMPVHLNEAAQREWRMIAPRLHRSRMFTEIDGEMLGLYCLNLATLKKAQAIIDRKGFTITTPSGYRQQRPEVGIVNRCMENVLRYGAHFGVTPASRSRIQVKQDADEEDVAGILS